MYVCMYVYTRLCFTSTVTRRHKNKRKHKLIHHLPFVQISLQISVTKLHMVVVFLKPFRLIFINLKIVQDRFLPLPRPQAVHPDISIGIVAAVLDEITDTSSLHNRSDQSLTFDTFLNVSV